MKKLFVAVAAFIALSASAQDFSLVQPSRNRGLDIMQTFAQRQSNREFSSKELSDQDLSDLLWATMGQNRDNGKLTAPSCQNKQEIRLLVFSKDGVSEYLPSTHSLKKLADGDHRSLVAGRQDFVLQAPVSLVMVADMDKFGSKDERAIMMVSVDAGIVSENACVAAAGLGLVTVPRASMDADGIKKLLGFNDNQILIMNNPVGYAK